MATNDERVNLFSKKLLSLQGIRDNFLDYLIKLMRDAQNLAYNSQGVFSAVTLAGTVNDTVDISILNGQDNGGHLLQQAASVYLFENTGATDYFIGFGFADVVTGVATNPRTGEIEYQIIEEEIGEIGDPDSVADLGGSSLKIIIDTLADAGHTYAGRSARVWLKDPLSLIDAFEDLTILWDGSNSYIQTTTYLGQTTPSTTATDYTVVIFGPKITVVDISASPGGRCYIGKVTGSGSPSIPSTFDTTGQVVLSTDFQLALNLTTIYKDVYKTPTFPDDGNPKFSDPIEFWWEQEHSNVDYSHDDVVYKTLSNNLQSGTQFTIQALDIADESNKKALFKDSASALVAWILGDGTIRGSTLIAALQLTSSTDTILGASSADDLTINASVIADGLFDNGGAASPILNFASTADALLDKIWRNGTELIIGRNDADGSEHTVSIYNKGAGGNVNLDVQGFIKTVTEVILENPSGAISPSATFKQSGFDDFEMFADNDIFKILTNSTANRFVDILNTGSGDITLRVLKFIITGAPSILEGSGVLQFKDSFATTAIPFTEAGEVALDGGFTAVSILGALNELKTSPLNHTELGDMPSAANTDHDGRYHKQADLGDEASDVLGSKLIGHANTATSWEETLVKGVLDDVAFMFDVQPKVPVGLYFGASHVVVPAQTVNCKGKIRRNVGSDSQLSWGDLDGGVSQAVRKAFYVYLQPDASPAKTYTPKISDVAPVRGFHPTGGKTDWIYVGSFVTNNVGAGDVHEFTKAGSTVILNGTRTVATHSAVIVDSVKSLVDGTAGVIPETAKMAIIRIRNKVVAIGTSPEITVDAAPKAGAVTNSHLQVQVNQGNLSVDMNTVQGPVGVSSSRNFVITIVKAGVGNGTITVNIFCQGWIEDNQFGQFL